MAIVLYCQNSILQRKSREDCITHLKTNIASTFYSYATVSGLQTGYLMLLQSFSHFLCYRVYLLVTS